MLAVIAGCARAHGDGDGDGDGPAAGIACGDLRCSGADHCVLCEHEDGTVDAVCGRPPENLPDWWSDANLCPGVDGGLAVHAGVQVTSLYCDDSGDCEADERCTGERGARYSFCWSPDLPAATCGPPSAPLTLLCRTDADCPPCSGGCAASEVLDDLGECTF